MEDIILLETKMAKPEKHVFHLQFPIGEFDMVITDQKKAECEIFEIKHSTEIVPVQYRFLDDSQKLEAAEFRYGTIRRRCVIYRGEDMILENGVEYLNVEGYLKKL